MNENQNKIIHNNNNNFNLKNKENKINNTSSNRSKNNNLNQNNTKDIKQIEKNNSPKRNKFLENILLFSKNAKDKEDKDNTKNYNYEKNDKKENIAKNSAPINSDYKKLNSTNFKDKIKNFENSENNNKNNGIVNSNNKEKPKKLEINNQEKNEKENISNIINKRNSAAYELKTEKKNYIPNLMVKISNKPPNNISKDKEKEKKEKEEKERIEKEEKEIEEKEKKMNEEKEEKEEMENENKKKKKIAKRIPKIQIKKEKSQIKMEDKKESDYSESSFKIFTQSNGEKSDNKKNNSESDYSYNYNCGKENSFETPAKNTLKKNNIISSDNKEKKEVTEEESEITEKMSEKYLLSINNSSEESEEESEEEIEREEIEKEDSGLEEEEESEEEKIEHKKKTKSIINNNRIKINLNEALNKYVKERNLKLIEKYSQFNNLIQRKLINEINNILKSLYIFLQIKNYKVNSIIKIESTYRGFILRQRFKLDYLTSKILNLREEYATKISSYYRMLLSRRQTKKLLRKTVDHYIIYSSLINNNQLYFKYKYQNGSDDNLYFEFCPMLKCFILFIDKREKMNKKILEGCFYNENYNALIDPLYEQNSKGENVINFPKIFQKEDLADEAKEIIISRYIKLHRPIKRRRERIEDYEERKRKMFEEEQHSSIRLSSSQTLKFRRIGDKVKKISRSKSFMKLKGFMKSILKPSKSYINLKCESKKKIHFGSAKIKRYHNLKK
jgi:hypothetical protein